MSTDHSSQDSAAVTAQVAEVAGQIRVTGIALVMGVVSTAGIFLAIGGLQNNPIANAGVLTWIGVVIGMSLFVVSHIVPTVIARTQIRQLHSGATPALSQILGVFRSKSIVGMALAEGGAFLNLIFYYLEGQLLCLGVVILLVTRMALQLPSTHAVENWVGDHSPAD